MAIVTSFCSEPHRKNGGGLFNVLMRVDGEDGEQLDQTTKMVEIGNSIDYRGSHTINGVALSETGFFVLHFQIDRRL